MGGVISLLLTTNSCKKDFETQNNDFNNAQAMSQQQQQYDPERMTELGSQLPNPYTVHNMQLAKDSLDRAGIISERPFTVRATHYYVKYFPQTIDELEELCMDTILVFDDQPVDYEVEFQGNWYRQPGLQDSVPTPHYATVPLGHAMPTSISYQILDTLYLPEQDVTLIGEELNTNIDYLQTLTYTGFHTANVPEEFMPVPDDEWEGPGGGGGGGAPYGKIQIFDTRLGHLIPLEGVIVTAKRWFTTYEGTTDANGNYYLSGTFSNPADYKIRMQRFYFQIMNNWLSNAIIAQNNVSGYHWDYNIGVGYDNMQGHMVRAAHRYFYGDVDGLKRPIRSNTTSQKLIAKDAFRTWAGFNWIAFPNIKIARYENSAETIAYDSDEIFSATIHELAHTAHVLTMNFITQYTSMTSQIRESWAVGVEWYLTQKEYKELGESDYGDWDYNPTNPPIYPGHYGYQYWRLTLDTENTSLFINLVDDFNENGEWFSSVAKTGVVNDNVAGYDLATIQADYLKHIYGLGSLADELKDHKPTGVTNAQIDLLLSFY